MEGSKNLEDKVGVGELEEIMQIKALWGMGFRNLQAFNLALLAKQGWQILSNPNPLMGKVYKAKYFPYDDILNAKLGSNLSYAWRSIFNSLEVIRKGTRSQVGNGKRIHIWEDKWLPTPTTHKVISTPRFLMISQWSRPLLMRITNGGSRTW